MEVNVCVYVLGEWVGWVLSGEKCLRTLKCPTLTRLCRFASQLHHVITCVTLSKPFNFSVSLFLNALNEISMVLLINNRLKYAQDKTFPSQIKHLISISYF